MSIKPGTLCVVVLPQACGCPQIPPLITMVTGGPRTSASMKCIQCGQRTLNTLVYDLKDEAGVWVCEPYRLRPLNDPDSAPADPAYTKRKETA